jgi:hypothetical protein
LTPMAVVGELSSARNRATHEVTTV